MERRNSVFIDNLIKRIIELKNHTVVGLDPRVELIPKFLLEETKEGSHIERVCEAFFSFNKEIIDGIYDIVPAVKPQIAFYEQYGLSGINAFFKTCEYAKSKGMMVIADVKRGDIGSTAKAYSSAYIGESNEAKNIDSITINPYLGSDSIEPFKNDCVKYKKGIFILVKTSNESSSEIQDLECNNKKIYIHVADMVNKIGIDYIGQYGYSFAGAVVGATFSEDADILRKIMKNSYFLVPGYGAQGGSAKDIVSCFNEDGLGAIINSSRGIIGAYREKKYKDRFDVSDFAKASRQAAIDMREDINTALKLNGKLAWED